MTTVMLRPGANGLADWRAVYRGAAVTLELAFGALMLGLVLGLLGAAAKLSASAWIRLPVTLFLNLLRGVPEFLILLIVYFGAAASAGAA